MFAIVEASNGSTEHSTRINSKKMFTIEASFITSIQSLVGSVFTDFLPLLALFLGLIIGAFLVERIVSSAYHKNEEQEK